MKRKFNRIKENKQSDNGASQSLEFIVILMFVIFLAVSFIDAGMFFVARSNYQSAAQQASRLAAVYGETNPTRKPGSIIEKNKGTTPKEYLEKTLGKPFNNKKGIISSMSYKCTDENGNEGRVPMGKPIVCTVEYKYNSMSPVFSFIKATTKDTIKVHGRSASEVTLFK